jgi:hypothetical protein
MQNIRHGTILSLRKDFISAGILEQSMGARNRVGIGLSYRPGRLHWPAESIPGLRKRLKIPAHTELRFELRPGVPMKDNWLSNKNEKKTNY